MVKGIYGKKLETYFLSNASNWRDQQNLQIKTDETC
jgi:hypothetical protein